MMTESFAFSFQEAAVPGNLSYIKMRQRRLLQFHDTVSALEAKKQIKPGVPFSQLSRGSLSAKFRRQEIGMTVQKSLKVLLGSHDSEFLPFPKTRQGIQNVHISGLTVHSGAFLGNGDRICAAEGFQLRPLIKLFVQLRTSLRVG